MTSSSEGCYTTFALEHNDCQHEKENLYHSEREISSCWSVKEPKNSLSAVTCLSLVTTVLHVLQQRFYTYSVTHLFFLWGENILKNPPATPPFSPNLMYFKMQSWFTVMTDKRNKLLNISLELFTCPNFTLEKNFLYSALKTGCINNSFAT